MEIKIFCEIEDMNIGDIVYIKGMHLGHTENKIRPCKVIEINYLNEEVAVYSYTSNDAHSTKSEFIDSIGKVMFTNEKSKYIHIKDIEVSD